VHGTADLPVLDLLQAQGVSVLQDAAPMAQQLGLRVQENHAVQIQTVLNGGAAEAAGFAPGDEWLGVELPASKQTSTAWRLKKLDQLPLLLGRSQQCTALISRDGQLLKLPLRLPKQTVMQYRLGLTNPVRVGQWLADK
jgi:predicted metalloprotease with PDZ domain